jgi:DNA-3-methyladenine glycosylase II
MNTVTWKKPAGFSLDASKDFYQGFTPGAGMAIADAAQLTLAFRLDGTFEAVAAGLREEGGKIVAQYTGTKDEAAVKKQIGRMLGLDADAEAWVMLGKMVPAVGKLQAEFPGFFTAAKPSPYDAACWGIIAPRIQIKQAAKIKIGIAEAHGDAVSLGGKTYKVFPSPKQLLEVTSVPGLNDEKLARLKGIARAALEGKLDPDRLRAMNENEALEALQELPGVGPWTAGHILYRGAALIDATPLSEPRVLHGVADAYGMKAPPSVEKFKEISETWRPFRMWVCVLLARHLGRAGKWNTPGLGKEREKAGRALKASAAR